MEGARSDFPTHFFGVAGGNLILLNKIARGRGGLFFDMHFANLLTKSGAFAVNFEYIYSILIKVTRTE